MCTIKYFLTCLLLGGLVMASEQEGIIESEPYKKLSGNNSEFGVMNLSTESDDIKVDDAVHNLLSHKFTFLGEELDKKIKESYDKVSKFENNDIINFLNQEKAKNFEDSSSTVTIYLPVTKTEEDIKNALLAAAYFPKELDPEEKPSYEIYDLKHVQEQLLKALYYKHPAAQEDLLGLTRVYYVSETHPFYEKIKSLPRSTPENYDIFTLDTKAFLNIPSDSLNLDTNDEEKIEEHFTFLLNKIAK